MFLSKLKQLCEQRITTVGAAECFLSTGTGEDFRAAFYWSGKENGPETGLFKCSMQPSGRLEGTSSTKLELDQWVGDGHLIGITQEECLPISKEQQVQQSLNRAGGLAHHLANPWGKDTCLHGLSLDCKEVVASDQDRELNKGWYIEDAQLTMNGWMAGLSQNEAVGMLSQANGYPTKDDKIKSALRRDLHCSERIEVGDPEATQETSAGGPSKDSSYSINLWSLGLFFFLHFT